MTSPAAATATAADAAAGTAWRRVALAMFAVGWGANQFSPLLIAYRDELAMPAATRSFLFGVYALGLVPGLLVGGSASDRWGRRAVVLPFVALSPVATVVLIAGHDSVAWLTVARLLAGVCSGVVFGAATAWVADLSHGGAPGVAAKRAAIALSAGFGVGPLVAGLVAQATTAWWPGAGSGAGSVLSASAATLTIPYVPHALLGVVATVLVWRVAGPRPVVPPDRPLVNVPAVTRGRRFALGVAPAAPWVFGSAAVSIAFLPGELTGSQAGALAFAGVLTGLTLGTGVVVQPLARRLDDRRALLAGQVGLVCAAVAIGLGVLTLASGVRWLLLVAAPVFGAAYGCCLVSGLREAERLAAPAERGATVAVFYALTYVGFAAPSLLGALAGLGGDDSGGGFGNTAALGVAVAAALACLAVVSTVTRRARRAEP